MTEHLYENEHYYIRLGNSEHSEKPIKCYQIINKEYDVVESESSVFPIAFSNATQFAEEYPNKIEGESKVLTLN